MALTADELQHLQSLLDKTHDLDPSSHGYLALEKAVAHLAKSAKKKRRLARKQKSNVHDAEALRLPGLARERLSAQPVAELPRLARERNCYVCKKPYRQLHEWYPLLCPECGERSAAFRKQPLELTGRRALVTGGRVKIGYATALAMLRAGAEVHVTSRFAQDAFKRYSAEPDFAQWAARLHLHRLDFRDLGGLLRALEGWRNGPPFDVVINNAAQTVWHPPAYFEALEAGEQSASQGKLDLLATRFEVSALDKTRVDSWVQDLGAIAAVDIVEVQVVNSIAPTLICNQLRENLCRSPFAERFVVNVTAVEGQFARPDKLTRHPHTNMAKAGLNMLTRTSAADLANDRIFMVSVDPGWMSVEGVTAKPDFHPPLAAEDCAARVLHPISQGTRGAPLFGVLLKDFEAVPW